VQRWRNGDHYFRNNQLLEISNTTRRHKKYRSGHILIYVLLYTWCFDDTIDTSLVLLAEAY